MNDNTQEAIAPPLYGGYIADEAERLSRTFNSYYVGFEARKSLRKLAELYEAQLGGEVQEWRQRHAECTTSLITADRKIARLTAERDAALAQLQDAQRQAAEAVPVEVAEAIDDALSTWVVSVMTDACNGYTKDADVDLVQQRSGKVRAWLDEQAKGEATDGE